MIFSNYRSASAFGILFITLLLTIPSAPIHGATPAKRTLDRACMQKASTTRDATIITALDSSAASLKAGLQKRSATISTGWGMENQKDRRGTLKTAWDDWKKTLKDARSAVMKTRVQAWKQFQTDRIACGPGATADEQSAQGAIDSAL